MHTPKCGMVVVMMMMVMMVRGGMWPDDDDDGSVTHGVYFDRIFMMVFANTPFTRAFQDPNFKSFATKGMLLTNYFADYHTSQPNYITMICGNNMNVDDDTPVDIAGTSLIDLLEDAGVTWKAYQESYPGKCWTGGDYQTYTRTHNPFISLLRIQRNLTRCAKIVNATDPNVGFDADLDEGTLPQFSFYTPNLDNDGSRTGVTFAGNYLNDFFKDRLSRFPRGTLIFVVFDEDDGTEDNHVYAALVGDMIDRGDTQGIHYNHLSALRTIEENWNLPSLGREDATAMPFYLVPSSAERCGVTTFMFLCVIAMSLWVCM